jgi:hypothetical protein
VILFKPPPSRHHKMSRDGDGMTAQELAAREFQERES